MAKILKPCVIMASRLVLVLALLFPVLLQAQAPVFDAVSSFDAAGGGLTWTWSHTVAGTNRILIVNASYFSTASTDVTGITYAGVALTRIGGIASVDSNSVEMWRLPAPATGANNIVVTFSASRDGVGGATSWTSVHQTTPLGTFASASGNGNSPSVNVTSATDEVVVDAVGYFSSLTGVGAGQTERYRVQTNGNEEGAASSEPGAATVTMSWTGVPGNGWVQGGVSIKPSGGGAPPPPRQLPTLGCCLLSINWVNLLAWQPCGMQTDCSFAYRVCDQSIPPKCVHLPPGNDTLDVSFVKKTATGESISPVGSVTLTVTAP